MRLAFPSSRMARRRGRSVLPSENPSSSYMPGTSTQPSCRWLSSSARLALAIKALTCDPLPKQIMA